MPWSVVVVGIQPGVDEDGNNVTIAAARGMRESVQHIVSQINALNQACRSADAQRTNRLHPENKPPWRVRSCAQPCVRIFGWHQCAIALRRMPSAALGVRGCASEPPRCLSRAFRGAGGPTKPAGVSRPLSTTKYP